MQTIHNQLQQLFYACPETRLATRIHHFSQQLLGKPYCNNPLGEGPKAIFDRSPLARLDQFDCLTYINTVIALALAHDVETFYQQLATISYWHGQVDYLQRHHFMSVDWNPANAKLGLVVDMTEQIAAASQITCRYTQTLIDRPNWLLRHRLARLWLPSEGEMLRQQRLKRLHQAAPQLNAQMSRLAYLPIQTFIQHPDACVFIPDAAVIEIVRPSWSLRDKIGTDMDVSHCGFAIWQDETLWFRHASRDTQQICQQRLLDYLQQFADAPEIGGINVQQVNRPRV